MNSTEEKLVQELAVHVITRMRDHHLGLYEAMRVIGYLTVAVAEAVDPIADDDASA